MARAETDLRSMIANGFDPKTLDWYESDLEEVPEPAKTLLEKYSHISPDQVVRHVNGMVSLWVYWLWHCLCNMLIQRVPFSEIGPLKL